MSKTVNIPDDMVQVFKVLFKKEVVNGKVTFDDSFVTNQWREGSYPESGSSEENVERLKRWLDELGKDK